MSDGGVFDEVDEELRREQLKKLWDRFGTYVIAGAVLIVAVVGGAKAWQAYQDKAAAEAGVRFEAAAQLAAAGKVDEAAKAFEAIATGGSSGYRQLALLRLAGAKAAAGKADEAVAGYDAIAKDSGGDPLLRTAARLQSALLRLDTADWTEMQNRLSDLNVDGNPWRHSARELIGMAAYKAGKSKEAEAAFQQILADPQTPQALQQRAQVMLSLLLANSSAAGGGQTN